MKKKVVAVCATVALAAVALGGATLAYFTDHDEVNNNFTIGDIGIDLWETAGVKDADGNVLQGETDEQTGKLVPTETGKDVKDEGGFEYENLMPSYEIVKTPVVKNTSEENAAYVRVVVEVENSGKLTQLMSANIDDYHEKELGYDSTQMQDLYDSIFNGWGIRYDKKQAKSMRFWMEQRSDSKVLAIDSIRNIGGGDYWMFDNKNTFMSANEKMWNERTPDECYGYYENDGSCSSYYAGLMKEGDGKLIYTFYLKLDPQESYTLFQGLNVPESFDTKSMEFFKGLKINIHADAIQTAGFNDTVDPATGTTTETAWQKAFTALEEAHPLGWWK